MAATQVVVFVGSLRKDSDNRKFARAIEKLAPADWRFDHVDLGTLPLYNQDFDKDYPAVFKALKAQVEGADALLFVTPEYNRSIPGVLKNALDIGSRPWGTNSFKGKPGAVIGTSPSAVGTACAQQHLRNILSYLDVPLVGEPEVFVQYKDGLFDADFNVTNDGTKKFLQGFVDKYVKWVDTLRA